MGVLKNIFASLLAIVILLDLFLTGGNIIWTICNFFADGAYKIVQLRLYDLTIFQIIFLIWLTAFCMFPIKDEIFDLTWDRWSSLQKKNSKNNRLQIETKFYLSLFKFALWCVITFAFAIFSSLVLGEAMNLYTIKDVFKF